MYKFYLVPDATTLASHSDIYSAAELFWDPRAESEAFAIIDPKMKEEMNKAASLEFTILPTNFHYDSFDKRRSVVLAYDDDELIFEGYVQNAPADFYKQKKVTCVSCLAYLNDSVQAPDEHNVVEVISSSGTNYMPVPEAWHSGANPRANNWYEQVVSSGSVSYNRTNDTSVVAGKRYYYPRTGDGTNYSGSTIMRGAATVETISEHISRLLQVHNAQVDPFKRIQVGRIIADSATHEFSTSNYRTTWTALENDIVDQFGQYFTLTRGNDNQIYLNYLGLSQMASADPPSIEFAVNMIEMTENDENSDNIFTILVPTGKNNITVAEVSGHDAPEFNDGSEVDPYIATFGGERRYVVVSQEAVRKYGYVVKTESFSDIESADELYARSCQYIANNYYFYNGYDVKALDLHIIDPSKKKIRVGDICKLVSQWHYVDQSGLFVLSADLDFSNPENDSYKIGFPMSDHEAKNRRISSKTASEANSRAKSEAGYSSAAGRMSSILEDYIHVTEWGLEMSSRLKNQYESADQMYLTRFLQDEEQIDLSAQKIFGSNDDDTNDAGYYVVPQSELYDAENDRYRSPKDMGWYEKNENGKYVKSEDETCDPAELETEKTYYTRRLWTRYSDVNVGPGGIKAKVDGNYERSTASSSWIKANEDSLVALTGHIHVDEEGNVIIDAGSGFRTGHVEDRTEPTFLNVPKSWYTSSHNPKNENWYEMDLDSSGAWSGNEKSDSATNSSYYKLTTDTSPVNGKPYYYISNNKHEFKADFGIYDENNLTAGVMVQAINNPNYVRISQNEVGLNRGKDAHTLGWYMYNGETGTYGLALEGTRITDGTMPFYRQVNNMETWTSIWGEHVVVGRTAGYSGMDAATRARVDKYIADNNLDGTITEIASDVVVVNALIAKYIESDVIVANTSLASDYIYAHEVDITTSTGDGYLNVDGVQAASVNSDILQSSYLNLDGVAFGSYDYQGGGGVEVGNNPEEIVMAFDTPTYSGDNVTIRYRTAGMDDFDNAVAITFTKPASLGSVTWSSGSKTLTAKTVGGRDFLVGTITPFSPSGQSEAQEMASAGYLETETTGYNQVYGLYYTYKNAAGNDVQAKTMLFKTPKDRYEDGKTDGISTAKGKFGLYGPGAATASNQTEAQQITNATLLNYNTAYMVYKTYDGSIFGDKTFFKTRPDRWSEGQASGYSSGYSNAVGTVRVRSNTGSGSGATINLGYSGSVTVYAQYQTDSQRGSSNYTNAGSITVKAPANNETSIDEDDISLSVDDTYTYRPDGTTHNNLKNAINEAISLKRWVKFHVTVNGVTKYYRLDFT